MPNTTEFIWELERMPALEHAPADMLLFTSAERDGAPLTPLSALILSRIACPKGATLGELVRDFSPLVAPYHSADEWRVIAQKQLGPLIDRGLAQEYRQRVTARDAGMALADDFLGKEGATRGGWGEVRDGRLIAMALDLGALGPKRLNLLLTPDGLRAAILQKTFGLSRRVPPTPARLRAALARVALERSFEDAVRDRLSEGEGFTASDGRLLAGQLARRPRAFQSDGRLIAHLAAEAIGAPHTDLETLRTTILRKLLATALGDTAALSESAAVDFDDLTALSDDDNPFLSCIAPAEIADERLKPTLAEFAASVNAAALTVADGWPGNYKAYIAATFEAVRDSHRAWDLNLVAFKCMLTEAHLAGLVELAVADLKSADARDELETSEITYKNTVWHQIRVS